MAVFGGRHGGERVGDEPVGRLDGTQEERRSARSGVVARASLACPDCDAPVAPQAHRMRLGDALGCPYCDHAAPVRDFLSLADPDRPARVDVRIAYHRR